MKTMSNPRLMFLLLVLVPAACKSSPANQSAVPGPAPSSPVTTSTSTAGSATVGSTEETERLDMCCCEATFAGETPPKQRVMMSETRCHSATEDGLCVAAKLCKK